MCLQLTLALLKLDMVSDAAKSETRLQTHCCWQGSSPTVVWHQEQRGAAVGQDQMLPSLVWY